MQTQPIKYSYKTTPYSHQKRALAKIFKLKGVAGLFMEMGTGKTKVAIDWASLSYKTYGLRRVLVVCPVSVMPVWKRQIRQHSPVLARIAVLDGKVHDRIRLVDKMKANPPQDERIEWIITNYESIWRANGDGKTMEDALRNWKPDLIIADESHKIKSASARQSRSVSRLARSSKMRLALTGTPLTKSPLDVFGQFRFLDPAIFDGMNWTSFRREFGVYGGFQGYQLKRYKNLTQLRAKVRAHSFRIRKEECLDLPEKVGDIYDENGANIVPVTLSDRGNKLYTEMAEQMVAELGEYDGEVTFATAKIVLTKILRLSQITSGFVKDEFGVEHEIDHAKLDVGMDLIEDLVEQEEKVVIFTRFRRDIEVLTNRLNARKIGFVTLSGSTPNSKRQGVVDSFTNDPSVKVFIAQIASGSLGIDLTVASHCIFYSWDYRWDNYVQATDRLHRNGQVNRCTYYHLAVPGSIDTTTLEILKDKANLAYAVIHDPRKLLPKL